MNRYGDIEDFPADVLGDQRELALLFKDLATLRSSAARARRRRRAALARPDHGLRGLERASRRRTAARPLALARRSLRDAWPDALVSRIPSRSMSAEGMEHGSGRPRRALAAAHRRARVARERPRADLGALARGAHASSQRGGRPVRAGRGAAAAVGQGGAAPREGVEARARRGRALRDRHPRAAREARLHLAERVRAGGVRAVADVEDDPDFREVVESQHCYVCKRRYVEIHPFYDQLCPECGDFNYRKRTETADLSGRVALLTGGRVKIGYQAGIKLLRAGAAPDRDDPLPARFGGALRAGARLRRVGRAARDLRPRPAAHAERRGVLPAPERDAGPPRLHRQQRLPDGAPAARVLPPHARAARPPRQHGMPAHVRGCSAPTRALRRYDMLPAGRARARRRERGPDRGRRALGRALAGAAPARGSRAAARTCSPRGASTRTCSRSICAAATPGGCCSTRCRRSSCSRPSS